VKIEPASALVGAAAVPGVKGISQRAVLLAAVAEGESRIRGFGRAADTLSAIDVIRACGVDVTDAGDDDIWVRGVGLRGLKAPGVPIDCGNAGTVLRLTCGLLAGQRGTFELVGDESLTMRPHERVAEPLRQVKSAILLAGLYADDGPTTVVEPHPTRDHTERMLAELGVRVRRTPKTVSVWPVDRLPSFELEIAGEVSSAAPLITAAVLLNGSELLLRGVNVNPLRTGLLDVLERMGARIAVFNRRTVGGEPVADLEVRSSPLVATTVEAEEVPRLVDELPLVGLLGSFARGTTIVRGAEELRAKESDRIETVTDGLRAAGVRIEAQPDGFTVRGTPARPRGGRIDAHGDHRIAMLGAVTGLVSREGVDLEGADSVAISFPGFFELLDQLVQR
jgi:3-phosphoshikimate 1-carboxyvinyltransferase